MDLLQRLFYTALSAASLFFFIVKVSLSHWKKRGILHEKPKFLTGNLSGVGTKRHINVVLQQLYEKYKGHAPFIGCFAYLKPMVLLLDLDLVQHVLITDAHYFTERGLYHNVCDDPLTNNLIQQDGDRWQSLHNTLAPCFETERIAPLVASLEQIADTMHRSLAQCVNNVCAVNVLVDSYNVDVISTLVFGLRSETLLHSDTEFRRMTRRYAKDFKVFRNYFLIHFPRFARMIGYKNYDATATSYFMKLVHEKLSERERNRTEKYNDFLQMFADLRHSTGGTQNLSDKDIAAQAFSFVLIGLETCNSTMTFCLYELALQPDLQKRVRDEVEQVLRENEWHFNMASMQALILLKQVIYETLRKHTPYPLLLRNTNKQYEVPNSVFMLQQDNHIVIPVAAIHHDSRIYTEPDKFDPDRFNAEALEKRHPMAFLPFGAGLRGCLARQFAEMQMLVGLATLLHKYSFSPCRETPIPMVYNNTRTLLTPKSDVKLQVHRVR